MSDCELEEWESKQKEKVRVFKPRNNVYVKKTLWTSSELDGDERLNNIESLPVVKRTQEMQLNSLLSINIKKIQVTTRKVRAREISISALRKKCIEI